MFDLSMGEMAVVGVVALIVVGPKDLPVLFRNVGRFVGKAKGMAREFSRAMNDAAEESGMRDVQKTFKTATNPLGSAMDEVKGAAKAASSWDPKKATAGLDGDRKAAADKIRDASAKKAQERKDREAAEAAAAEAAEDDAAALLDDSADSVKSGGAA
ncbi:Sec-independent protein translocase protein TatB [Mesobacterium pallidum]|uniref:Sec-independent protein translocase protein TatB n=1 Tax=Mesobacterium pallidum TaxID=2872037 RepID=UPI001EE35368|nr:Sec-independent protein translocase protein TatB [Mesobacterium pallidum]